MTTFIVVFTIGIFLGNSIYGTVAQERDKNDPDAFQEEAAQIYSTIFHKYNERVRPPDNFPNPVLVTVEATLYHIRDLDLQRREMESLLDLKIMWKDKRLAWYPYQVQEITANVSAVWSPDIVYTNGAVPPRAMFAPKVSIKHDGEMTWNRREAVVTMCRTQPGNVNQTCEISLGFVSASDTEMFGNDTTIDLTDDFENHIWDISGLLLDRYSNTEISFVLYLSSKSANSGSVVNGSNCSHTLKYKTSGSSVVNAWTSSVLLIVATAMSIKMGL
ncbi:neuronal acetylcholine receptor subunit alpha-6-like [Haliotis asinina]|uniref:neuronal acetylcholine receptor subunit alpha-6-like n=1 Tax=Haliotis asinina TaxID=109174 RepID=UPI003531FA50